jgi:hypothetical protein
MARGQSNNGSNCDSVYAKICLKSGDDTDPRFELEIPNPAFGKEEGAEKTLNDGREDGLSGKIVGVSAKTYDYKGDEKLSGKIILEDKSANEIYFIQFGQSSVARNLINSLAGINQPGEIELGLYINKRGHATISVTNNGDKTEWAWHPGNDQDNDYVNKIEWVHNKKKKKDEPDFWELDKWLFLEVLGKDIKARVEAARKADPVGEEPTVEHDYDTEEEELTETEQEQLENETEPEKKKDKVPF